MSNDETEKILIRALVKCASFPEGDEVNSAFDEPTAARVAREALKAVGYGHVAGEKPEPETPHILQPTVLAALTYALWNHQGDSSEVGQPIRKMLGMGPHERMTELQVDRARIVAARLNRDGPAKPDTASGWGFNDQRAYRTMLVREPDGGVTVVPYDEFKNTRGLALFKTMAATLERITS